MALWQVFKISRKTFFNPSAWFDVNGIKEANRTIIDSVRDLFIVPVPTRRETFEEAVARQNLTMADINRTQENYFIFAYFFLTLTILVLLFSFYLLFYHASLSGLLIGIGAAGLFLAQAFRFHFWHFQIKNRKLGCTFEEWRNGKINSDEGAA